MPPYAAALIAAVVIMAVAGAIAAGFLIHGKRRRKQRMQALALGSASTNSRSPLVVEDVS
jgi:hypothetical protein